MSEKFELIVIYGRRRVGKTDSFLRQLRKYHTFTIWRLKGTTSSIFGKLPGELFRKFVMPVRTGRACFTL